MHLEKSKIRLVTATIVCMNAMIGAGIFTAPVALSFYVGPSSILAYIFVVIAVLCMALSFGRLALLYPQEGSFYTYTKPWMGHSASLLVSFVYIGGMLTAMALLTKIAASYIHSFFPFFSVYQLAIIIILGVLLLNICGVIFSEIGQYLLIICTLFPLLAITFLCLWHAQLSHLFPFAPDGFSTVFKVSRIVIFGFFGFEAACSLFPLMANPQQNVSRALVAAIISVGSVYTLFIASIILAIDRSYFYDPNLSLVAILHTVFPDYTLLINSIHIAILSAILGTLHSMLWGSSILLISLIRKMQILSDIDQTVTKKSLQKIAVLLSGFIIFILFSLINNLDLFFSLTAVCIVSAYLLSMVTLLTLKNEWLSGRNIITVLGCLTGLTIFYFGIEGLAQELTKMIQ